MKIRSLMVVGVTLLSVSPAFAEAPSASLLQLQQATGYLESYAHKKCPRGLSYADQMMSKVIQKTQLGETTAGATSDNPLAQEIQDAVSLRRQAPTIEAEEIFALRERIREKAGKSEQTVAELKRVDTMTANCEAPPANPVSAPAIPTTKISP